MFRIILCMSLVAMVTFRAAAQKQFEKDTISTSAGNLVITFIGHGTLIFEFNGKVIHVDPWGKLADYAALPKADLIFITHDHPDHLDPDAVKVISTDSTKIFLTQLCYDKLKKGMVMRNGDTKAMFGINVKAVPAYNFVHKRDDGKPYHVKGECNGYVFTFGDKQVYVAGDTENIEEMKNLRGVDIAFLPMNLPYTMTPEMVVEGVKLFLPKILYPYHTGETDVSKLVALMKDVKGVEVRVRSMK